MVETTLEIRFSADDEACVTVRSNASVEAEQQAELVSFGHYAARIILLLGPERAFPLVRSLTRLEEGAGIDDVALAGVRVVPCDEGIGADRALTVLARFLNTRGGPRMFFRLKRRGLPPLARGDAHHEAASVHVLLYSLLNQRATDARYLRRLARTAGLIGRLASSGRLGPGNEFDVSLAAADVAWRTDFEQDPDHFGDVACPACGNPGSGFEYRLWPSDRSAIRKCTGCGAGLWLRARRRPRLLRRDVWRAMEAMRAELSGVADAGPAVADDVPSTDGEGGALLADLKRVFVENRWPFSEVRGAPVLLSELSGALGRWKFYAQVVAEHELILLFSVCPLRAPEERRLEVSHFLTRANYGLAAGNFELDFDDGEIRYKTVLQLQGGDLESITVKRLVRANGIAMETYLPGIGAVITGTPALSALERRTSV